MKKITMLVIFILFGLSIAWADDAVKSACPDGVKPNASLEKTTIKRHYSDKNSYEEEYQIQVMNERGKCFKFNVARFEYLVDNNHAIYSMHIDGYDTASRLFLFDFGNSTVKQTRIVGIIKTTGEYFNYKDSRNVPQTMPRVIVVKENKI
jgi:hypothetical protein